MKYLYILRHGTAGTPGESENDFDRELTPRGILDISAVGTLLTERNTTIDLIISSAATRTMQTARNIAALLDYPPEGILERKSLYLASSNKILSMIEKVDNRHTNVMLVGHNPGISDLAPLLASTDSPYLPPGGLICLKLFVDDWNQITPQCGVTEFQEIPVSFRNI
jgi:phosphohistidine phosphatase